MSISSTTPPNINYSELYYDEEEDITIVWFERDGYRRMARFEARSIDEVIEFCREVLKIWEP